MTETFAPDVVLAAAQGVRARSIDLVRSLDDEAAATVVPTCPDWTVKELVCHMYGTSDDILNGRLEGAGSEAWTAAQIERHGGSDLVTLSDAWAAGAPAFD